MLINWGAFFTAIITTIIAILGWWVVSYLRDKENFKERKRNINIEYLIKAHRVLSGWVHKKNLSTEEKAQIESVLADIQLLGSVKMIDAINDFYESYNNGGDIIILLDILVSELRTELKLDKIKGKRKFFRFESEKSLT